MNFDVLIEQFLNEAIGSRGGHISIEEALTKLDTENDVNNFIRTSDPHFLIYPLMVASDHKHTDKKIKFGKEYLSGMAFVNKVKEVFFTNESSPNYINLPKTEDGQIATQAQFLNFARQAKKENDQDFLNKYKEFSKTPHEYKTWGQLLSLVIRSTSFKESDRRQGNTEPVYVKYINSLGNEHDYRFHITPEREITNDPFSSPTDFQKPHIKPKKVSNMSFAQFKKAVAERGNTIDAVMELIDGQIGRSEKKQKTLSLVQRMKLGLA